jgi:ketosteroid isomerase-like protein
LVAVGSINSEDVQRAYDTAAAGDVEPLVALLHPDLDWRGLEHGHLWWRKAPA